MRLHFRVRFSERGRRSTSSVRRSRSASALARNGSQTEIVAMSDGLTRACGYDPRRQLRSTPMNHTENAGHELDVLLAKKAGSFKKRT